MGVRQRGQASDGLSGSEICLRCLAFSPRMMTCFTRESPFYLSLGHHRDVQLIQARQTWLQSPFCPMGTHKTLPSLASLAESNLILQEVSLNAFFGPAGRCIVLRNGGQRHHWLLPTYTAGFPQGKTHPPECNCPLAISTFTLIIHLGSEWLFRGAWVA